MQWAWSELNQINCGGQPLTWPFSLDLNVVHYLQLSYNVILFVIGGETPRCTTTRLLPITEMQSIQVNADL